MSELLDRGLEAHGGLSKNLALTASASASIGADRLAKRGDDLRLVARDQARLRALSTRL